MFVVIFPTVSKAVRLILRQGHRHTGLRFLKHSSTWKCRETPSCFPLLSMQKDQAQAHKYDLSTSVLEKCEEQTCWLQKGYGAFCSTDVPRACIYVVGIFLKQTTKSIARTLSCDPTSSCLFPLVEGTEASAGLLRPGLVPSFPTALPPIPISAHPSSHQAGQEVHEKTCPCRTCRECSHP